MLTQQQRLYAEFRKEGLGKRAAAIAAGCPDKTAAQAGSRYEKNAGVQAHMRRLGFEPEVEPAVKKEIPAAKKTDPKPQRTAVEIAAEKIVERATKVEQDNFTCPLKFMESMMNETAEDPKLRLDAAKALASFTVAKPGEKGKKEERQEAATKVSSSGRFSASAAPLRSVK